MTVVLSAYGASGISLGTGRRGAPQWPLEASCRPTFRWSLAVSRTDQETPVKQAVIRDGQTVHTFNVCAANPDDVVIMNVQRAKPLDQGIPGLGGRGVAQGGVLSGGRRPRTSARWRRRAATSPMKSNSGPHSRTGRRRRNETWPAAGGAARGRVFHPWPGDAPVDDNGIGNGMVHRRRFRRNSMNVQDRATVFGSRPH